MQQNATAIREGHQRTHDGYVARTRAGFLAPRKAIHPRLRSAELSKGRAAAKDRQQMTNRRPKTGKPGPQAIEDNERTVTCAKVTEPQRDKAKRLGGGACWVTQD